MTGSTGATRATGVTRRSRELGGHVYPVDMVRVLTFGCVIAVHTVTWMNPQDSIPGGAATMLLHFTREAFFVLTAFVLVHRYRGGRLAATPFWRRRFLLVGVPYVVWSIIYTVLSLTGGPIPPGEIARRLAVNLVTGAACYHLYFLLVSMQFYLLFPLFLRLLRATRGRHGRLLAVSAAIQLAINTGLHIEAPTGLTASVLPYAGAFVGSYPFYLVLGGVAALHRDQVEGWIRTHRPVVLGALLVSGAAAECYYLWSVHGGSSAAFASDVFQPVMLPWCVAVVAGCYALGAAWAERRRPVELGWVRRASDRSFGVFLVHPLVLWLLTLGAAGGSSWLSDLAPAPVPTLVAYVVAVAVSLAIVELLRHTRLSLVLTGKGGLRPTSQHLHSPADAPSQAAPARWTGIRGGGGRLDRQAARSTGA